jgi:enoyl-CoA hydratase/carnithine racemase
MTGKLASGEVVTAKEGPVYRLEINRPERRNAMSWEVIRGLRQGVADAREDPSVRVLVLSGAGDQAFCSGADLGSMGHGVATGTSTDDAAESAPKAQGSTVLSQHEARGELARLFEDLWGLGKPTIARVQGWAMAGGFGLALACDLVVASDRARFGAPEVNVGLWPYMITVPMVRSMPPKKALELMMTGRVVGAAEAERIGFVTRVVPHEDLDAAVGELAEVLAQKPPGSIKLGRDSFYSVWDMGSGEALAHLQAMLSLTALTEDAAEGMAAFLEKRTPRWQSR